jgi:K+-transporting ATPase ATPase C chain
MKMHLKPALIMMAFLTFLTGVAYPLAVTGVAQLLFPGSANGSVLRRDGKPVGSSRIGQSFDDPRWFWGRLSATSPVPYTAFNAEKGSGSAGSNLGPLNPALHDAAAARVRALRQADPANPRPIPIDLVTASGSGLDPDIGPAAADYQVERVARARALDPARVRSLIAAHTQGPQFGFLGESRVNVLEVNLALEGLK